LFLFVAPCWCFFGAKGDRGAMLGNEPFANLSAERFVRASQAGDGGTLRATAPPERENPMRVLLVEDHLQLAESVAQALKSRA
jgi:hypothetical protein